MHYWATLNKPLSFNKAPTGLLFFTATRNTAALSQRSTIPCIFSRFIKYISLSRNLALPPEQSREGGKARARAARRRAIVMGGTVFVSGDAIVLKIL